jgi:hypothetical protein
LLVSLPNAEEASARHKSGDELRPQLSVCTWISRTEVIVAFRANKMPLEVSFPARLADTAGRDQSCVVPVDESTA